MPTDIDQIIAVVRANVTRGPAAVAYFVSVSDAEALADEVVRLREEVQKIREQLREALPEDPHG